MQPFRVTGCKLFVPMLVLGLTWSGMAMAQKPPALPVPNFWDGVARPEKPDLARIGPLRFLVDDESAPFSSAAGDGLPSGFSIELARAICAELKLACTMQVMRFDLLLDALEQSTAEDVVIAPIRLDAGIRQRFETTNRYFTFPARFVGRQGDISALSLAQLGPKRLGVVADSAHAAYLKAYFAAIRTEVFASEAEAEQALLAQKIDLLFGDGVTLGRWLTDASSQGCCTFVGGPYLESHFFGEGLALLARKGNVPLRMALDHALARLWDNGRYGEIYLRHFPIPPH